MAWESFEFYLQKKMKRLLLKPFSYWPAYAMGIINDKGEKLRNPTTSEASQYNVFDELIRRIKVTFMKYVPNKGIIRHVVFKEFLKDGFIQALDEEKMNSFETVQESIDCPNIEGYILNWLNNFYNKR
jgi:hypothetical protein